MRLESIQPPKPFQAGALALVSSIGDITMGHIYVAIVARLEDAGAGESDHRWLTDVGASRSAFEMARPRAARFQPGQYRNMSVDRGRPEVAGRRSARHEQPVTDVEGCWYSRSNRAGSLCPGYLRSRPSARTSKVSSHGPTPDVERLAKESPPMRQRGSVAQLVCL